MARDGERQPQSQAAEPSLAARFDRVYGSGYFNDHVAHDGDQSVGPELLADLERAECVLAACYQFQFNVFKIPEIHDEGWGYDPQT